MANAALPQRFMEYLHPLVPTAGVVRLEKACCDHASQLPHIAQLIDSNQMYAHFLHKFYLVYQEKLSWTEEDESDGEAVAKKSNITQKAVLLFKQSATRNFVFALRIHRNGYKDLPRTSKDALKLSPRDDLKFALMAEEHCQDEYLPAPDRAFLAGAHYDWISAMIKSDKNAPKTASSYLEQQWTRSFRAARIAVKMTQLLKGAQIEKYAFAGTLVLGIGRVLMHIFYPKIKGQYGWEDFIEETSAHGLYQDDVAQLIEHKRFAITSGQAAWLFSSFLGYLSQIEKSIYYTSRPYNLRKIGIDLHKLGVIFAIANSLAGAKRDAKSLPLTKRQMKWLVELRIVEADVLNVLKAIKD